MTDHRPLLTQWIRRAGASKRSVDDDQDTAQITPSRIAINVTPVPGECRWEWEIRVDGKIEAASRHDVIYLEREEAERAADVAVLRWARLPSENGDSQAASARNRP